MSTTIHEVLDELRAQALDELDKGNCYGWGSAVGGLANRVWYFAANVTRPTVPGAGAWNGGWLNAHFVNDGKPASRTYPNVRAWANRQAFGGPPSVRLDA